MYRILISKKILAFIKGCSPSDRKLIHKKFGLLKENPYSNSTLDIKKLKAKDDFYRLRIGKYRFIYEIQKDRLLILMMTAGTRGNIYK
jgi:mRNA interferase RelE/StbE